MTTALLAHVSEKQLRASVEVALTSNGWRWVRAKAQAGANGWPDLFAVRGSEAIALELKREDGRVSVDQVGWLAALTAANIDAMVIRPSGTDHLDRRLSRQPMQTTFTTSTGNTGVAWTVQD